MVHCLVWLCARLHLLALKPVFWNFAVTPLKGCPTISSKETLHPILQRARWSFNIALAGRRPSAGLSSEFELTPRQKKLAGTCLSSTFAVTEVKADWAWHIAFFKMWKYYWKCGQICFRCNAARIPRSLVWSSMCTCMHAYMGQLGNHMGQIGTPNTPQ